MSAGSGTPTRLTHALELGALTLAVLVPCAVLPWIDDPFLLPKEVLFESGAFTLAAFTLARSWRRGGMIPAWIVLGIILFTAGVGISTYMAYFRQRAIASFMLYSAWLAWIATLVDMARGDGFYKRFICWISIVGVLQVVIGSIQIYRLYLTQNHFHIKLAFGGTFGNPEYLASFLAVALLFIFHAAPFRNKRIQRTVTTILAIGLVLTQSRGALLSFAAAVLAIQVLASWQAGSFSRLWRFIPWFGVAFLCVVASLLSGILPEAWTSLYTMRGRFLLWLASCRLIAESHGLGIGLDNFAYRYMDAQRALLESGRWNNLASHAAMVRHAHCEYLNFLVEGGVLTIAALGVLCWTLIHRIYAHMHRPAIRPYVGTLVYACLVSVVAFPLHVVPTLMLLGFAGAKVLALPVQERCLAVPSWVKAFTLAAAIIMAGSSAYMGTLSLCSQRRLYLARFAITKERLEDAEQMLREALHLTPNSYEARLFEARLLYRRFDSRAALEKLNTLERCGRTIDSTKLRGLVLMELGDLTGAERVYRQLASAFPRHITPRFQLSRIYMRQGRRADAIQECKAALSFKPLSFKARFEQILCRNYLAEVGAS